jgi:hypothetical protein
MTTRRLDLALWGVACCGVIAAVVGWRDSVPAVVAAPMPVVARAPVSVVVSPETLTAVGQRVAAADPFRLDRHPAAVPYRPDSDAVAAPVIRTPRPSLVLQGIVGGKRWAGLVAGIPGREGAVLVHAGDTLGGLTVRRVGPDTVVVGASDTTWRLTVRQAWQ